MSDFRGGHQIYILHGSCVPVILSAVLKARCLSGHMPISSYTPRAVNLFFASCSPSERWWACQWICLPTIWHWAILCLRLTSANHSWNFQNCNITQTVPQSWELLHEDTWGSGEVPPHPATCQRASSLPLATGRWCCWPPQHQLSNWPVQFLWTTFSHPLGISDQHKGSWKRACGVPVLRTATSLKRKLGNYFETTLVFKEV